MDFNSSLKTPAKLTTPKTPERKLPFNVTKEGSSFGKKSNRRTTNNGDNKLPLMMMSSRTPLQSPSRNPSLVCNCNYKAIPRKEEKMPVKRCFSKEVLDLSQLNHRQIVVTKHSKVDISLCPPKRVRMDDFAYSANSSRSRQYHTSRDMASSNEKRKEMLRFRPSSPAKLSLPHLLFRDAANTNSHPRHRKDGVRFHPAKSTTKVILSKRTNPSTSRYSHFLVSIKNFPREEWRENNYDAEMLREIIFLSDTTTVPVDLIQKGSELVIKFANASDENCVRRNSYRHQKRIFLCNLLKLPIILPLKVITGVIKWIIGK